MELCRPVQEKLIAKNGKLVTIQVGKHVQGVLTRSNQALCIQFSCTIADARSSFPLLPVGSFKQARRPMALAS